MAIFVNAPIARETVAAHPASATRAGPGPIAISVIIGKIVRINIVGAMNTLMNANSDNSSRFLLLNGRVAGKLMTSAEKSQLLLID